MVASPTSTGKQVGQIFIGAVVAAFMGLLLNVTANVIPSEYAPAFVHYGWTAVLVGFTGYVFRSVSGLRDWINHVWFRRSLKPVVVLSVVAITVGSYFVVGGALHAVTAVSDSRKTPSTNPSPKSLHDYFIKDNFGSMAAYDPGFIAQLDKGLIKIKVEAKLYEDFNGKSDFLGFYI